ncbi:Ig-like domain-containing protein, partial [Paenibacillus sp. Soil750]|uniref:Ig-like domain-containing protein n=1 Tax=Paenibacillus sp. Soil750 TaxID=1736398 RepID=UPI003FA7503F
MNTSNNSASYATTVVSNDSLLSNLTVSKGILAPAFDASTRGYTLSLPYVDDTLKVMPTVHESHATVTVNNSSVESGSLSEPISLLVGNTDINITVRAEDGTTTTTVITVNRALPVSSIAVSGANDATSVIIGSSLQMSAFVSPGNAGDKSITWSIDAGTGNASISSVGLLTGTALGEVLVKATATDGSGIVGTKSITIAPKKVTSIDIMSQGEASSVQKGEQLQLSALVYPTDATNRTVVWSVVPGTGDATIDESTGMLTGTAVGEVIVKATATDESGIVGTMNIEITKIPVTSIEVISESESTNVRNGKTLQLRALVSPDDATDRTVKWSVVPGTGNAEIDSTGVLTGTAVGTVTVTATANDNPEIVGTLEVTIKAIPVTGMVVTSEGESASVRNGKTLQMIALVSPDDATDRTVKWSVVPGTGNAEIDSTGILTGTAVGTV